MRLTLCRALVFVAGLTLGLQSFSKLQIDYEVETAFAGARRNLEFLAVQSPQASHYLEILRLLQIAITKQREQHARMSRSRYVSKICAAQSGFSESHHTPATTATTAGPRLTGVPSGRDKQYPSASPTPAREANNPWTRMEPTDEILFDWDHLDLSQWDDFPLPNAGSKATAVDAKDPI